MLQKRHSSDLKKSPDALEQFIYLTQPLGELDLKNPFLTISLARDFDNLVSASIKRQVSAEDAYHAMTAEQWASRTPEQHQESLGKILKGDSMRPSLSLNSFQTIDSTSLSVVEFKTKEDFFKHRESALFPFSYVMPFV